VLQRPTHAKRKMAIDFTPARRAGDMVLRCENVRKAYGDVVLFDDFNLEIYRGEKIGIIGPNGVGKTTLLEMAMRHVEPDAGEVRLFENLDVGYYDQEHAGLNLDHSVIGEIEPDASGPREAEIRSFLARFLFRGGDVYKRVGNLSGGEQSRVTLAKLVWSEPQVLVLDEPTNHLDIPGKEALEDALIAFEGAILLVSHDRYFLDRVVNKLLVLPERSKYELIAGNWSTYEERLAEEQSARLAAVQELRKRARRRAGPPGRKGTTASRSADDSPYASWSLARVEDEIVEREQLLAETEQQFADPGLYRDAEKARELRVRAETLRAELAALNQAWEAKVEEVD